MTAGESAGEVAGGLQAPHVTRWGDTYHMFYGTWDAIAQAISADGKSFTRVLDGLAARRSSARQRHVAATPASPLASPTCATMLFSVEAALACSHCLVLSVPATRWARARRQRVGTHALCASREHVGAAARSRRMGADRGAPISLGGSSGAGPFSSECPCRARPASGCWYLFRTQRYTPDGRQTSVYISRDPSNFGVGDGGADAYLVARLPVATPEVVMVEGALDRRADRGARWDACGAARAGTVVALRGNADG